MFESTQYRQLTVQFAQSNAVLDVRFEHSLHRQLLTLSLSVYINDNIFIKMPAVSFPYEYALDCENALNYNVAKLFEKFLDQDP